jgi:hypothetical protein
MCSAATLTITSSAASAVLAATEDFMWTKKDNTEPITATVPGITTVTVSKARSANTIQMSNSTPVPAVMVKTLWKSDWIFTGAPIRLQ